MSRRFFQLYSSKGFNRSQLGQSHSGIPSRSPSGSGSATGISDLHRFWFVSAKQRKRPSLTCQFAISPLRAGGSPAAQRQASSRVTRAPSNRLTSPVSMSMFSVLLAGFGFCWSQSEYQQLAVRNQLISRGVLRIPRNLLAIYERVAVGNAREKQICLNEVSFPVDLWIDAVKPFGPLGGAGDADIVGCRAHPHCLPFVSCGLLPEAQVMPLGEGVKTFLKDKIWCRAVQREQRNWGSLVTTLAQAGLQSFEICPKASRIRQCPSGLLKRRLQLLLRAQEEHVNNIGGCFASFSAHRRFPYESLETGFDCKNRPARPGLRAMSLEGRVT